MLSVLLAIAASAETPFYQKGHWVVLENDQNCILVSSYSADDRLWVTYDYGLGVSKIIYTNKAFKSADSSKKYRIKVSFIREGKLVDHWGIVEATGIRLGDDGGLTFTLQADDALGDIATSSVFALTLNGNILTSLSLNGSADAVTALRFCAKKMNLRNPSDPLQGAEVPREAK